MGETMLSIFRTGLVGVIPKLTVGNVGIETGCGI
jgi:hypothetical protein